MFIGREKELVLLQQDYIGKAVMVYGKRRVGKTTLIQKALDNCPYQTVYFECLKGTVQENIDSLFLLRRTHKGNSRKDPTHYGRRPVRDTP